MDQMVGYMGMMAYNTGQMSAVADKMERKSDTLLANLKDKSSSVERSFQNHSQGVLDNERAMIRNLQGIREELGQLKESLRRSPAGQAQQQDQVQTATNLQMQLNELQKRLAAISAKVEKLDSKNQ